VRLGRCPAAPPNVQILERRQVLHLPLHPQALRTLHLECARTPAAWSNTCAVERLRRTPAVVDRAEPRHITRLLFYPRKCYITRALHTGPCWAGELPTHSQHRGERDADHIYRHHHGSTTASRLACGCEHTSYTHTSHYVDRDPAGTPPWTTLTESKRAAPVHRAHSESCSSTSHNSPERQIRETDMR
jgi:hypothetical protein